MELYAVGISIDEVIDDFQTKHSLSGVFDLYTNAIPGIEDLITCDNQPIALSIEVNRPITQSWIIIINLIISNYWVFELIHQPVVGIGEEIDSKRLDWCKVVISKVVVSDIDHHVAMLSKNVDCTSEL